MYSYQIRVSQPGSRGTSGKSLCRLLSWRLRSDSTRSHSAWRRGEANVCVSLCLSVAVSLSVCLCLHEMGSGQSDKPKTPHPRACKNPPGVPVHQKRSWKCSCPDCNVARDFPFRKCEIRRDRLFQALVNNCDSNNIAHFLWGGGGRDHSRPFLGYNKVLYIVWDSVSASLTPPWPEPLFGAPNCTKGLPRVNYSCILLCL
ncbi:hypothetical protein FKM82_026322 [Ascaphus truei]